MARHPELQELRPQFYSQVEKLSIPQIQWRRDRGNHKDFSVQGWEGHVNWYFQDAQIDKYGGNVCVVFKDVPEKYKHSDDFRSMEKLDHKDWRIASEDFENTADAAKWVDKMITDFLASSHS